MLDSLKILSDQTNDANVLDRVLSLLTQASAALKTVSNDSLEVDLSSFEVKEKFAPAQKNEKQLRLWKTAKDSGRKPSRLPMKLVTCKLLQCIDTIMHLYIYHAAY